ncbi:hypothetical protein D1007_16411 [Hordeum vulgare]|nr:hypothetical protein D1007_16411 [Hordeum vulgare]
MVVWGPRRAGPAWLRAGGSAASWRSRLAAMQKPGGAAAAISVQIRRCRRFLYSGDRATPGYVAPPTTTGLRWPTAAARRAPGRPKCRRAPQIPQWPSPTSATLGRPRCLPVNAGVPFPSMDSTAAGSVQSSPVVYYLLLPIQNKCRGFSSINTAMLVLSYQKWLRKHNKKSTNLELANSGDYTTQDINFQIGAPLVVPARRDAVRYEIQVQRELCEQLEVQKKLQMRIEAQGRYLKEILEKAQENISFDANGSAGLENARSQLTNFNLDLPGLSDNGTHVYEESSEQLVKAISDDNLHDNNLDFQLYRVRSQEAKNDKCTPKTEDLLLLDLNIKEGYDLSS